MPGWHRWLKSIWICLGIRADRVWDNRVWECVTAIHTIKLDATEQGGMCVLEGGSEMYSLREHLDNKNDLNAHF